MSAKSIGDVAGKAGIRASAIRYYERKGVLPSPSRTNGRRQYYDDTILKQLAVLQLATQAGFTIREIKSLFRDFAPDVPASARWRRMADGKLRELEESLRRTELMRSMVRGMLKCGCATLEQCGEQILRHRGSDGQWRSSAVLSRAEVRDRAKPFGSAPKRKARSGNVAAKSRRAGRRDGGTGF
jgi:MerR family redox-sensitive transcriptional activator SoxR